MIYRLTAIFVMLLLSACAQKPVAEISPAPPPPQIIAEVPVGTGSLWTTSQGALLHDVKARNIGDIVTVAIFERASASQEARTSTGRNSSMSANISRFFGLEKNIGTINSAIDPTSLIGVGYKNEFQGSGSTMRKEDLVATLTTRVVEVYPNGTMRIEGSKMVAVNRETQIINLSGIIRQSDISPHNIVDSKYVLDARIDYTGKGVMSDKQGQGWATRILDNIWPF